MLEVKTCKKCGDVLTESNTRVAKSNKDGVNKLCRKCLSIRAKQHYEKNKERIVEKQKRYYEINKERVLEYHNEYYELNKEAILKRQKEYAITNKDVIIERMHKYYEENKVIIKEKQKAYCEENKVRITKYKKQYVKLNKCRLEEQGRKYCNEHPSEVKGYNEKYRRENKSKIAIRSKKYRQSNKDKTNVITQRYRAKKRLLDSTLTVTQWEEIKLNFDNRCAYCGNELPLAQEHFIPLSRGGEYTHNNIIPACRSCNASKNNKPFEIWYPTFKYYSKKRESFIFKFLGYKNGIQQLALM